MTPRSRNWIWFFVVLVGLTTAAVGVELWYNLRQQLRPESLVEARRLWREKGPADYEAEYLLKRHDGSEQRWLVTVQDRKVASVRGLGGQPLDPDKYSFDRMESLFDHIEKRLEADAQPGGPRVFATAVFDRTDGHVLRYVRSTRSPRERLEVTVQVRGSSQQ